MAIFSQPHGGVYTLATGETVSFHEPAYGDPSDGTVTPNAAAGRVSIGVFDNTGGDVLGDGEKTVHVDFLKELPGRYYPINAGSITHPFVLAYGLDDGSVTATATGNPLRGRVLFIDAVKGAFVADAALSTVS